MTAQSEHKTYKDITIIAKSGRKDWAYFEYTKWPEVTILYISL